MRRTTDGNYIAINPSNPSDQSCPNKQIFAINALVLAANLFQCASGSLIESNAMPITSYVF